MANVTGPRQLLSKDSPFFDDIFFMIAREMRRDISDDNSTVTFRGITDFNIFNLDKVRAVTSAGGVVTEYPCVIELTPEQFTGPIPEVIGGNGSTTFEQHNDLPSVEILDINGTKYAPSGAFGSGFSGTQIVALEAAGYTVLSMPEFIATQPSGEV